MFPVPVVVVFTPPFNTIVEDSSAKAAQASLNKAAKENNIKPLRDAIKAGVNLSARTLSHQGNSLLHTAAYHGSIAFIKELSRSLPPKEFQQLLNQANQFGSTPLHSAAKKGQAEAIELLLTLGADQSVLDHKNRTPLKLASQNNHRRCAQILKHFNPGQDIFISSKETADEISAQDISTPKPSTRGTLNPFAQPFSPQSPPAQPCQDGLPLPASGEWEALLGRMLEDVTYSPDESSVLSADPTHLEFPPTTPLSKPGRLNVFTGQWNDPFLPERLTPFSSNDLALTLKDTSTLAPLQDESTTSNELKRISSHYNVFTGYSDPFTPLAKTGVTAEAETHSFNAPDS